MKNDQEGPLLKVVANSTKCVYCLFMKWKSVKNYEERYEVSDCGIIRKVPCKSVIGQWINDQGYCLVRLSNPRAVFRVHRLVADAFIPNPDLLPCVNHIDCVRHNNHACNLEWCTQSQNIEHSDRLGRMKRDYWKGKRSPNAKLSDQQADEIRQMYVKGNISWEKLAKMFKTNKRTIGRIVRRETYI
jgi:hypothetical protein